MKVKWRLSSSMIRFNMLVVGRKKIIISIHSLATLLGYSLLVPGWTPFVFRTALILRGIDSQGVGNIPQRFWSICHDSITQLLQICRLHIHDENLSFHHIPKVLYWIEIWWLWRTLSKVNSLSCSRNQSEMIWALWHGALSCWKYIRRWYTVVIKEWTWTTILR